MADRQFIYSQPAAGAKTADIDAGLQAHMSRVYALMAGAMVLTGVVAYIVGTTPALLSIFMNINPATGAMSPNILGYVAMFAPLLFVFLFSATVHRMAPSTAQMVFWAFGAVMGLSIAWIFAVYTGISIAQTFFVTAIAFGALSIYGYTTKKDLGPLGSFLFMGVIGLVVASIVNLFVGSLDLHFAISALGVLIFAGLTAVHTQEIKNTYLQVRTQPNGEAVAQTYAVVGALSLYLSFLNMFMFLLSFLGNRE